MCISLAETTVFDRMLRLFLLVLGIVAVSHGKTVNEWKTRVIYQILTDRFAKSSDTTQSCGNLGNYCGGLSGTIVMHRSSFSFFQARGKGLPIIWTISKR